MFMRGVWIFLLMKHMASWRNKKLSLLSDLEKKKKSSLRDFIVKLP